MKKLMIIVLVLLAGCVPLQPIEVGVTSGSKSDGNIIISAQYPGGPQSLLGDKRRPQMFTEDQRQMAVKRCAAWGYTDAQPFGSSVTKCINMGHDLILGNFCITSEISVVYQCTGGN